jgi:ABC-2 type transport system ATP-binding protein
VTASSLDEKSFQVDGVTALQKSNSTVSFFYKGDINVIAKLISNGKISDLTVEDLTLEEIFMHYYE